MLEHQGIRGTIESIEKNLMSHSLCYGRGPGGKIYDEEDIKWVYTGGGALNRVFIPNLKGDEVDDKISQILSIFKDKEADVNWIFRPSSKSYDIAGKLKSKGLSYKNSWSGMALYTESCTVEADTISGFKITKVTDDRLIKDFAGIVAGSFNVLEEDRDDFCNAFTRLGYGDDKPWTHYMGMKDGRPVASCTVYRKDNVAGLYWVGTLPSQRKQGLASAMVSRVIHDVCEEGLKLFILQASAMGKPVYERLGFAEYCKFEIYTWSHKL